MLVSKNEWDLIIKKNISKKRICVIGYFRKPESLFWAIEFDVIESCSWKHLLVRFHIHTANSQGTVKLKLFRSENLIFYCFVMIKFERKTGNHRALFGTCSYPRRTGNWHQSLAWLWIAFFFRNHSDIHHLKIQYF